MLDMLLELPTEVDLSDGRILHVTAKANWVEMMKCSNILSKESIQHELKVMSVLTMFYDEITIENIEQYAPFFHELVMSMYFILAYGEMEANSKKSTVRFEKDIKLILEGISMQHGEIRGTYLHWWTFLDYFRGIKDSTFNTVNTIRHKRANGKKLDKWEKEFLSANKKLVALE